MKKKIAILGSTGSIGKTTLKIIKKNLNLFEVVLLTTNTNIKDVLIQAKIFNVKNIIINDKRKYQELKNKIRNNKYNIYNNYSCFKKFLKKKIDYTMSSISGLEGLLPTIKIIKHTKQIAIANKESIICGWNIINKELKKHNTKFLPIDSEHFSIWSLIKKNHSDDIDKIYLTASGGPFLNYKFSRLKNIRPNEAIKHPRWKMGKKISVDSSNLINKVFEVIEASRIFNLKLNKFKIIIHPNSYLHSIVKFNNGTSKLLVHDTKMEIPIFNSIFNKGEKKYERNELNIKFLNNLNLSNPNVKIFPNINILKYVPNNISLFETVLVTANDELVGLFLNNKIKFLEINKYLIKILKMTNIIKYKKVKPINFDQIIKTKNFTKELIHNFFENK